MVVDIISGLIGQVAGKYMLKGKYKECAQADHAEEGKPSVPVSFVAGYDHLNLRKALSRGIPAVYPA